jgi:hypothetical protein
MSKVDLVESHFLIDPWSLLILYSNIGQPIQVVIYHTKTENGEVIDL